MKYNERRFTSFFSQLLNLNLWYGSIGFYDSELQIQRKSDNSILANHSTFFYYSLADLISPLSMCFHEDMELSEKSSKRGQRSAKYRSVDDPVVARP